MAKHAQLPPSPPPSSGGPGGPREQVPPAGWRRRRAAWVGAAAAVLVVAAVSVPVAPGVFTDVRARLPWNAAPQGCAGTVTVEAVVAPAVEAPVTALVAGLRGHRLDGGSCLAVRVRAQDPLDTVEGAAVLPPSRAPQVWVGDSSLWTQRLTRWEHRHVGSLGASPVVLLGAQSRVDASGWTASPPTWTALLTSGGDLTLPALPGDAGSQLALAAVWQAAGRGEAADRVVAAATLAAQRSPFTNEDEAVAAITTAENAAATGAPASPDPTGAAPDPARSTLVVGSEQAMLRANQDAGRAALAAVYPADGSPMLDFPVERVADDVQDPAHRAGTDLVVAALTGPQARDVLRAAGLRDADGGDPPSGVARRAVARAATPGAADLAGFLARWTTLSQPSRMLTVVDVSLSMRSPVPGTGTNRVQLAGRAAAAVHDLLPDSSSAGLWAFAQHLDGDRPYRQLAPVEPLGAPDGGTTHRRVVHDRLLGMESALAGGGTGLYATALAAVRAQRVGYDAQAANLVLLLTDGENDTDDPLTLEETVQALRSDAAASPDRPVRLVCIGIGPDTDADTLRTLAAATGGSAYQADSPGQLQSVLYDAIARRP